MDIEEVFESPAFWLLGVGGLAAEVMGYMWSRNSGLAIMPFWQLLVMMGTTLIAAAYFGTKE